MQFPCAMWALPVVVLDVDAQHSFEVVRSEDEQPVEALRAHGTRTKRSAWAFGPRRLLYGSNWPVSEATGGHERWSSAVWGWAVPILSDRHSEGLEGYNALAAYRLGKA